DGFVPGFAQRERCVHAAVVELDALADTIRAAAEDHDLLAVRGLSFTLLLVRGVHVSRRGGELRRASVDALVNGPHAHGDASPAYARFVHAEQRRQTPVGESLALERTHAVAV